MNVIDSMYHIQVMDERIPKIYFVKKEAIIPCSGKVLLKVVLFIFYKALLYAAAFQFISKIKRVKNYSKIIMAKEISLIIFLLNILFCLFTVLQFSAIHCCSFL